MGIKNNLQGNSSRVDEAENQINDLEHQEAKINASVQQEEKRIQKYENSKQPLGQLQEVQHSVIGVSEGEEKQHEIGNILKK